MVCWHRIASHLCHTNSTTLHRFVHVSNVTALWKCTRHSGRASPFKPYSESHFELILWPNSYIILQLQSRNLQFYNVTFQRNVFYKSTRNIRERLKRIYVCMFYFTDYKLHSIVIFKFETHLRYANPYNNISYYYLCNIYMYYNII